jgi:hypothetical protein
MGGTVAPKETTRGGAAPVAEGAGSPPGRSDEIQAHDAPAVFVRVSFDRVAEQLPSGAFHVSRDRIGASLSEPGHLLIPQRLVLTQLAEGFVRAGWDVVAEQFPRHLLSMTDEEITRHLADGQIVLPLDELVPQLPPDLFALSGQTVDVDAIESVPAPFQPAPVELGVEEQAEARMSDVPPMAAAEAVTTSLASKADWSLGGEARTEGPPTEIAVLEDVELDPILMGPAEGGSLSAIDTERRPACRGSVEGLEAWPRPAWATDVASPPTPEALTEPVKAAPDSGETATMHRVITALTPLRPLDVGVESSERLTLFTVSPSGLDKDSALTVARLLLPLLAEGRAPWPVDQLTIRGADAVLILTPLGVMDGGGSVLLSVVPPGGAVASVERLALRAVARGASDVKEVPARGDSDQPEEWQEPDLLDSEPPTRVHQIGASLGALGPVTAGVLRDVEAERDLILFLPEGADVRMTGRFAGELEQALRKAAQSGYTFHTAVLRSARRRLIIRLERAATGRATIVVAGGLTERPGLACRQVEAAALALSGR